MTSAGSSIDNCATSKIVSLIILNLIKQKVFLELSTCQVIIEYPDKMLLMWLALVLLVFNPGLPRPESRQQTV